MKKTKFNTKGELIGRTGIVLFMAIVLSVITTDLFSQDRSKPSRQSSMSAFSRGEYEKAYNEFSQLLVSYPKDPLYKYYAGVSLVMMEKDPEQAANLLQQAVHGSSAVRSMPQDAMFYLGRAQHMSGKYKDAVRSYEAYASDAGRKAAKERNVPELIRQCNESRGKIEGAAPVAASIPVEKADTAVARKAEVIPSATEEFLDEALNIQYEADSISNISKGEKDKARIDSLQKAADIMYSKASASVEMSPVKDTVPQVKDSIRTIQDSIALNKSEPEMPDAYSSEEPVLTIDSLPVIGRQAEIFSVFAIFPDPEPGDKVKVNPEYPSGLVYRIQIAVFRNPVTPRFFRGITPVYGFKSASGATTYYAGMFRRLADAKKALAEIKAKGFKDSFVVAVNDGKTVSLERAALLENEWGHRALTGITTTTEATSDTIPPSLVFRVEVVRTKKPLADEEVESIRRSAGNRGLDIVYLEEGSIVYLIGKFITFTSAEEYADLLVRNGFRDARVVAWLGKKEIPVETARQLFENSR